MGARRSAVGVALWSLALLALAACSRERSEPARSVPTPVEVPHAPAPVAKKPAPTKTSPSAAAKGISQADVYALVDRWLAAQNRGDFPGYERLYARELRGIKRVGERVTVMDRAAWLADRARMFRKPMIVAGDERVIRISGAYALVELTQRFTQGKFMDRGRKQLLLELDGGELRIVEEEMLNSELAAGSVRLAERFLPLVRVGGQSYALLRTGADRAWGQGRFTHASEPESDVSAYLRAIDPALVPDTATWLGRALHVYGAGDGSCRASIAGLFLYAGAIGGFHTDAEEHGGDSSTADDASGQQAFDRQAPSLVGRLDGCDGLFALPAELPAPAIYRPEPLAPEVEQRALAAARATEFYGEKQREYVARFAGDDLTEAERAAADEPWAGAQSAVGFGAGDRHFVVVEIGTQDGGAPAVDWMIAVYARAADGSLQPVNSNVAASAPSPTLLLDLDNDGDVELLSGTAGELERTLYAVRPSGIGYVESAPYYLGYCGH